MQLVIAIPEPVASTPHNAAEELLRPVCGVPLLSRVLSTSLRAGADNLLLLWPQSLSGWIRQRALSFHSLRNLRVVTLPLSPNKEFDPSSRVSWETIERHLSPQFLWLPWNWITVERTLSGLHAQSMNTVEWNRPALIDVEWRSANEESLREREAPEGVAVISPETARDAERYLVRRSGKTLDGIHTSSNRYLCRPVVRWLCHTRITPNAVSIAGLFVALLSLLAFRLGTYWFAVLGASLFFLAGLFDEIDGMLARIKFMDSPLGCWLESAVDGISYLFLFVGIAVGLHQHHPQAALWFGIALVFGTTLSLIVTMRQRRLGASHERPHEHLGNIYAFLEKDSSNLISRTVRKIQPFQKKGVMIYYLLIFTVSGGLRLFFLLATLGSNLTWLGALYYNRYFCQNQVQSRNLSSASGLE